MNEIKQQINPKPSSFIENISPFFLILMNEKMIISYIAKLVPTLKENNNK